MKLVQFNLSSIRPFRFLIVVAACAVMFFANVLPASAIGSYNSSTKEGETQLNRIQQETEKTAKKAPAGLKEVQERANQPGATNEVQGSADIEQMNNPENSQGAKSVESEVEDFLERITGQK